MTSTLAEVCAITMGQAPPGKSYNDHGDGLPLIAGAGDFNGSRIAPTKHTTQPGKIAASEDIVLSIRASIGAKVWADREYCLGRGVAGLRPGPMLDSKYLWHWLTHSESALAAKGRGATFRQVNRTDIGEMPISLPALDEQRRIAAILDHADALRAKRRQVLAHLDSLTQSIFHDMFGDPTSWPSRWPIGVIGDMTESVQYGTSAKAGTSGEWPILRMGNLGDDGRLDLSELKYLDLGAADVPKYTVRRGDLLFNRTNSREKVGKAAVVQTDQPLAVAGYLVRVRFKSGHRPEFVSAYLASPHGVAVRRRLAKAAVNQANINASEMRNIAIAHPPYTVQDEFASYVAEVDAKRNAVLRALVADDELFASLQARAFRGEL